MKIAIGFFGITRSLKYTIASINKQILDVFKNNQIEYDIFIHTYHLTNYKNIRTREKVEDHEIDNEEYKLLNANYIEIDNQQTIKEKLNISLYRTHPDPWNTNYNSVDNFILGSYSKFRVTNMIEKTKIDYDYILFMRPDCMYLDKFVIAYFNKVDHNSILIPNFHCYGKYNINDRFAVTTMKTYKIYGNIFIYLLEMSKKQPLHSETIIGEILYRSNLNIIRTKLNFSRIRFNGKQHDNF